LLIGNVRALTAAKLRGATQRNHTSAYADRNDELPLTTSCQLAGRRRREDTASVEPNEGVVAGDLRVLVTRTGADPTSMSLGALARAFFVGGGWKVTVSPADSAKVLAEQRVGRRRTAEGIRDEFVRVASGQGLDRTDAARIRRLLRT
jgi:hypothetical protein